MPCLGSQRSAWYLERVLNLNFGVNLGIVDRSRRLQPVCDNNAGVIRRSLENFRKSKIFDLANICILNQQLAECLRCASVEELVGNDHSYRSTVCKES